MKNMKLTKQRKSKTIIGLIILTLAASIALFIICYNNPIDKPINTDKAEIVSTIDTQSLNIEITADDLQTYKENIGDDMDIKKSALIIFDSVDTCQSFIDEYGANDDILSLGKGIIPEMQGDGDGYFNVVGNTVFERLFDMMEDGEFLVEPVEFGGMYCYFKRLERVSITDNDEAFTEFIKRDKAMRQKGGTLE